MQIKFKNLDSLDKTVYRLATIISTINIICISYAILVSIMLLFNTPEYSKILIDTNLYSVFYKILNFIDAMVILTIIIAFLAQFHI